MVLINFNSNIFFVNSNSFLQNIYVAKDIRKDIINFLNNSVIEKLICIGGEAYLIGLSSNCINIVNYTNSKYIYNDVIYNNKFYRKIENNMLINYSAVLEINSGSILMINLARLNINLMKIINKNVYNKIIIINCHHNDFWKKIKLLTNYKLICRKQFITDINFITVNIFVRKNAYISLGNTCAISYQLNKLKIRSISYPFDWCKMNIKQLNNVLENNFINFSNIFIKKYSKNHENFLKSEEKGSLILKNKYNITFAHEIINKYDINSFKIKLNKRIECFINLINPTFIILDNCNFDEKHILKLITNLRIYFKNFKIIFISKKIINHLDIICIKLKDFESEWKFPLVKWKDIITYY